MNMRAIVFSFNMLSLVFCIQSGSKQAFPVKVAGMIADQVVQKSLEYADQMTKIQTGLKPYQQKIEQLQEENKKIEETLKNAGSDVTPEARRQRQARQAELQTAVQAQMQIAQEYFLEQKQMFEIQFANKVKEAAKRAAKKYGWDAIDEFVAIVNEDCDLTEEVAQELNNQYLADKKKAIEQNKTETAKDKDQKKAK